MSSYKSHQAFSQRLARINSLSFFVCAALDEEWRWMVQYGEWK
jgi:hypothetical protein